MSRAPVMCERMRFGPGGEQAWEQAWERGWEANLGGPQGSWELKPRLRALSSDET